MSWVSPYPPSHALSALLSSPHLSAFHCPSCEVRPSGDFTEWQPKSGVQLGATKRSQPPFQFSDFEEGHGQEGSGSVWDATLAVPESCLSPEPYHLSCVCFTTGPAEASDVTAARMGHSRDIHAADTFSGQCCDIDVKETPKGHSGEFRGGTDASTERRGYIEATGL